MNKISKRTTKKSRVRALILVVVAIIALVAILELTNTTHFFHAQKAQSGTIPTIVSQTSKPSSTNSSSTPSTDTSSSTSNSSNSTSQSSPKDTSGGVANSDASLIAPYGSFVSNHSPSLSASPPTKELSSCSTSVGASCHIEFTQGNVTRKLESRTVDNSGTVSWLWDVSQAGLTAGTWKVTAVASLNGQTKSTTDQLTLEVSP